MKIPNDMSDKTFLKVFVDVKYAIGRPRVLIV